MVAKRILYVEDSNEKYMAVSMSMKSMGFKVPVRKTNLSEAIDEIVGAKESGEAFDVVITDMNYPLAPGEPENEGSGEILIDRLQEKGIDVPVIVISSFNYNVEKAFRSIWFVKSRNWEDDLERAIQEAIQ